MPTYIYHLGDFDPSGVNAANKIDSTLRELAPNSEIHFERLAVTEDQIREWSLPSRPTKKTDPHAKKFGRKQSVELDAIEPEKLRLIVENAIRSHISERELNMLLNIEEDERQGLMKLKVRA